MSTTIHKVLGYGLTDIVKNDPRFSKINILNADHEAIENKWNFNAYNEFLISKGGHDASWNRKFIEDYQYTPTLLETAGKRIDLQNLFFAGNEDYGMKNVLCIVPLMDYGSWYRAGNDLDWYQDTYTNRPKKTKHGYFRQYNHVKLIPEAIYPCLDFWDSRDGRKIGNAAFDFRRAINAKSSVYQAAIDCGFQDEKECLEFMSPMVPKSIQYQIEFGEIFTDNKTMFQMKPMIYTYWA